jgi:O-antigen/teichoic acid export membrane protein
MMSQLDRTLLGIWIGVAAVTTYSIPLSIATRIHQLCAKALEVVFPLSSGLETQSRTEQIRRLFLRAQNLNVVLVVMLSVPLMILAPEILRFWISGNFAVEAALVFRLLVIAYALLALNVVMAGMVAGFGHPEVNTAFVVLLGLSNLLGYFLLIPSYGVNGAGMASAFGSLVSVPVFLWYVNHRFLKVPLPEVFIVTIIRPTFAGFIMGVCLFLARPFITGIPTLFLVLSGGCIIFFVMTILLGVWQAQELEILRQVWSRVVPSHIFRN